jgi:two-component system, OmpR family, sensor histidine kinase AdeS
MSHGPRSLSSQLILLFGFTAFLTSAFMAAGINLYSYVINKAAEKVLSPAAQDAQKALIENRVPDPKGLAELMDTASQYRGVLERYEALFILGILIAAILFGASIGIRLSRRLRVSLQDVASAARRVTAGDLEARAPQTEKASMEIGQLTADFNKMAAALENTERANRENAAAIAHELRTPLTILSGRLQGISDGVFDADPKTLSGLISQVSLLTKIVDDLNVVRLADTGKLELNLHKFDLAAEIDELVSIIAPDIAAANMSVELNLKSARMKGDAVRLRQAALSMIDNAKRYAASGGSLRIETSRTKGFVMLRILDRGPGFPDEAVEHVFERFWRADASRSRELGGSGLGLSVVHAIIVAHGGVVSASNREGGGAVFEFRIPA